MVLATDVVNFFFNISLGLYFIIHNKKSKNRIVLGYSLILFEIYNVLSLVIPFFRESAFEKIDLVITIIFILTITSSSILFLYAKILQWRQLKK